MRKKREYNEYDLWFSENAGSRIRALLDCLSQAGGAEGLYRSSFMPNWKREKDRYERVLAELEKKRSG